MAGATPATGTTENEMRFGYFFTMYALEGEPYKDVIERAVEETKVADDGSVSVSTTPDAAVVTLTFFTTTV